MPEDRLTDDPADGSEGPPGSIEPSGPIEPLPSGPPGGRTFTLEGRPVPSLYLLAWLLSVGGLGALVFALQGEPSPGRSLVTFVAIVSLGLGLAAAAGYQLVARADRHPDRYRGPSPLLLFGIVLIVSSLGAAGLALLGLGDPEEPVGFLTSLAVVGLAYVAVIWLFVVRGGALSWQTMGWPPAGPGWLRGVLRDIGFAALVMLPVTFGVLMWGGIIGTLLQVTAPETLPPARDSVGAFALVLAAAVVAPIGEEMFFRGFVLTAWLRDLGPRRALVWSALFFAVVHILNIQVAADQAGTGVAQALLQFLVILPLGFVLGWLFLRRGIVAAIAGHITYNGILLALLALARASGVTSQT
ncbi:MAG: CPBP family intramembrane metalloprotease [Chloroflexi bacterium]|nr:CPBP family intramembrane metalloprotease [Chloroflexota bacterium]